MITMRKIVYIISMAVAMCFASCQDEIDIVTTNVDDRVVSFSAESISTLTRVSGSEWEKDDAIGIFVVGSSSVLYDNVKYLADESGLSVSFAPSSSSETILYPEDGSAVSYLAYYPYIEELNYQNEYMVFGISGQDGSQEEQEKADLLKSTINDVTGSVQKFKFSHSLSKVQITVSNYTGEVPAFTNLKGLSASIYSQNIYYNISSGQRTLNNETKELGMVKTMTDDDANTAVFTAIITPGEVNDQIIFTDGIKSYSATLSIENAASGSQYNFSVEVGDQGLTIVELTNDGVSDWDTQDDSTLGLDIEVVDNVYQIYTNTGLEIFASLVNGGETAINGKLMNDIELSGVWTPIGSGESTTTAYCGVFDGDNFTISGLNVVGSSAYQALFGSVYSATIKNLSVGGTVTYSSSYQHSGLVAGFSRNSTFTACTTLEGSSVEATGDNIGGIAGWSQNITITDCTNNASVTGGGSYTGGIVGCCSNSTTIMNSSNTGDIKSSDYTGGIAGIIAGSETDGITTLVNCHNSGTIEATREVAGGLAGYCRASRIYNSYNRGTVKGGDYVGGLVGNSFAQDGYTSIIENCYTTGVVTGTNSVGIVLGTNNASTITNCYYDSSLSGSVFGTNGYSETTANAFSSVSDLLNSLNSGTLDIMNAVTWVWGSDSYPTFSYLLTE